MGGTSPDGVGIHADSVSEFAAQFSKKAITDFWKEFKNADQKGNEDTGRMHDFIERSLSVGGRGGIRHGRVSHDSGISGKETMFFSDPIAGFDGYYTVAKSGRVGNKPAFLYFVVPSGMSGAVSELKTNDALLDKSIISITFSNDGANILSNVS